jgi:hypothetical protein
LQFVISFLSLLSDQRRNREEIKRRSTRIFEVNPMKEEMCLVDSCTINSILKEIKYFQTLTMRTGNILTIAVRDTNIVGSSGATIILLMGMQVTIDNALLYPDSTRTLLSYRDIH